METSELAGIRHDLKNVLTALRSGCLLIEKELPAEAAPRAAELLEAMREELSKGSALVDRLRGVEQARGSG